MHFDSLKTWWTSFSEKFVKSDSFAWRNTLTLVFSIAESTIKCLQVCISSWWCFWIDVLHLHSLRFSSLIRFESQVFTLDFMLTQWVETSKLLPSSQYYHVTLHFEALCWFSTHWFNSTGDFDEKLVHWKQWRLSWTLLRVLYYSVSCSLCFITFTTSFVIRLRKGNSLTKFQPDSLKVVKKLHEVTNWTAAVEEIKWRSGNDKGLCFAITGYGNKARGKIVVIITLKGKIIWITGKNHEKVPSMIERKKVRTFKAFHL